MLLLLPGVLNLLWWLLLKAVLSAEKGVGILLQLPVPSLQFTVGRQLLLLVLMELSCSALFHLAGCQPAVNLQQLLHLLHELLPANLWAQLHTQQRQQSGTLVSKTGWRLHSSLAAATPTTTPTTVVLLSLWL